MAARAKAVKKAPFRDASGRFAKRPARKPKKKARKVVTRAAKKRKKVTKRAPARKVVTRTVVPRKKVTRKRPARKVVTKKKKVVRRAPARLPEPLRSLLGEVSFERPEPLQSRLAEVSFERAEPLQPQLGEVSFEPEAAPAEKPWTPQQVYRFLEEDERRRLEESKTPYADLLRQDVQALGATLRKLLELTDVGADTKQAGRDHYAAKENARDNHGASYTFVYKAAIAEYGIEDDFPDYDLQHYEDT